LPVCAPAGAQSAINSPAVSKERISLLQHLMFRSMCGAEEALAMRGDLTIGQMNGIFGMRL